DVLISSSGSANEQAYLTTVNNTLFPSFPSTKLRALVTEVRVFGPPIIQVGAQRTRYGVGTIAVKVGVFENVGTTSQRQVAEKLVRAVINEVPYKGPGGPLQSCTTLQIQGNFEAHWGPVTASTSMDLPGNLDNKVDSGMPWRDYTRF